MIPRGSAQQPKTFVEDAFQDIFALCKKHPALEHLKTTFFLRLPAQSLVCSGLENLRVCLEINR